MSKNNASPLVAALEGAWEFLQGRYPQLPDAVIVLGSGADTKGMSHWGSWTSNYWLAGMSHKLTGEFMLAGERAGLGAEAVYETLLHEAAHALAEGRGIKDTSRNGRYHNTKFKDIAEELGLKVQKDPTYGWTHTTWKADQKNEDQRRILRSIKDALKVELPIPPQQEEEEPPPKTSTVCECACPRKLRLKDSTRAEGPVLCGVCEEAFEEVA